MVPPHCLFRILTFSNGAGGICAKCACAITIGAGCIGAPLVLADYKEDERVRWTWPIFMIIAYYLFFTNRKRKYVEEKTTITLKSKQSSIGTVRNHLRILASLPTSLIFHWSLPLKRHGQTGPFGFWTKLIKAQRRYDMNGRSQRQGGKN